MGIIKAFTGAIKGSLADQWLEVYEAGNMGDSTVFTAGVPVRQDGQNTKGTERTISNGSIIHVYPNQFMMLVDGGKVVDYTAEEGYYKVDNSSMPSLFNGQFGDTLKETFSRIKYGGIPSGVQKVFFINLQEIKGMKFGTQNPINYFDSFYNAELFLRCHGNYTIKVVNPLLFYSEVIPKNASRINFTDSSVSDQYLAEFLEALQAAINQMSADGERISFVTSKGTKLSAYMRECLDEDWTSRRGFAVESVGIASISYDEQSNKLIQMRNQGAMLSDAKVREGYVQSEIAQGIKAAGSNTNGAAAAFMGMGMGMNTAGNFMGAASATNAQQMQMDAAAQAAAPRAAAPAPAPQAAPAPAAAPAPTAAAGTWTCECGTSNTGKFCTECGAKKPEPSEWTCECGAVNTGKFCSNCGAKKPESSEWTCECGAVNSGRFCTNCGKPRA